MAERNTPGEQTLKEVPAKVLRFLGAVALNESILIALAARGYTKEIHQQGWDLVQAASGFRPIKTRSPNQDAVDALNIVDAWDEPTFDFAQGALQFEFPEQYDFVFEELSAQQGVGALVSSAKFLDRLDELERGRANVDAATKEKDKAAVAHLATRKIDAAERARIRALIGTARGVKEDPVAAPAADVSTEIRAAQLKLYAWYSEWRRVAARVITRRDYLIQLGIAERRSKKDADNIPIVTDSNADDSDG